MKSARRLIVVLAIGLLALFIQGTLIKSIAPTSMLVPNLNLIIVAFLAFREPSVFGAILSFLLGIQFDFSSGVLVGPWSAAFVAAFGLLSMVSQRVFVESPPAVVFSVLVAVLVANLIRILIILQFSEVGLAGFTWALFGEGILTALLAPLLFKALKKVLR